MTKTADSVWMECLSFIKDNIKPQAYKTWFEPIKPVSVNGHVLTIQVPSQFFYEYLEEHYLHVLRQVILNELGPSGRLEYSVIVDSGSNQNQPYSVTLPNQKHNNQWDKNRSRSPEVHNPFEMPSLEHMGFQPSGAEFPSKEPNLEVVLNYHETRDIPGIVGTSRLGIHRRRVGDHS